MEGIRREAERLAREEFRALVKDMVAHPGTLDKGLAARYAASERIVDAIDAYQRIAQATDQEAPLALVTTGDWSEWTEGEKVAAWGR
jgi:hypothetical protein